MRAPLLANKLDGDCFALVRAHQHDITIHNQDVMRKGKWGNIIYHILLWGGEGELGNSKVLLSIRLGWRGGGGGGGGRTMLEGGTIVLPLPFCIKPDKLIAVDNLNIRIDCPPLNNE